MSRGIKKKLLQAIILDLPNIHNRDSLLKSEGIREIFQGDRQKNLTDTQKTSINRSLANSIQNDPRQNGRPLSEVLWFRGDANKGKLSEAGLIAVSVDITTLREENYLRQVLSDSEMRNPTAKVRGPFLPPEREPSQQGLMEEILERAKSWNKAKLDDDYPILAITNICIVHGSESFDILVNVIMKNEDSLLQFTRDVVQGVPHVSGTQTMLISAGFGLSNPDGIAQK